MGKQDNGRYRIWFILFFSLLLLLIIGASVSLRSLSDMVIDMGRSGFAKEAAWRSGAGVLASAAIVICLKGIVKRKQGLKGMIGRIFGIAACLLAKDLNADVFVISTAVEKVCLNYNKPDEKKLDTITLEQAEEYIAQGQFPAGSMLPKIEAAADFVRSTGNTGLITDPSHIYDALYADAGTRLVP